MTRHSAAPARTTTDSPRPSRRALVLLAATALTGLGWLGSQLTAGQATPEVVVATPRDGLHATVVGQDRVGRYAVVLLDARLDDGETTSWRWTSDAQPGALLNERRGSTRLYAAHCGVTDHRVTATALIGEGARASSLAVVHVDAPC